MACLAQMTKSPCLNLHRQNNPSSHSAPASISKEGALHKLKFCICSVNIICSIMCIVFTMLSISIRSPFFIVVWQKRQGTFTVKQSTCLKWCKVLKHKRSRKTKVKHNSVFMYYYLVWVGHCCTTWGCRSENTKAGKPIKHSSVCNSTILCEVLVGYLDFHLHRFPKPTSPTFIHEHKLTDESVKIRRLVVLHECPL